MNPTRPLSAQSENTLENNMSKEMRENRAAAESDINGKLTAKLTPPPEMTKGAKQIWKDTLALYKDVDSEFFKDTDKAVLTDYCVNYDLYLTAMAQIAETQKKSRFVASTDEAEQDRLKVCYKVLNDSGKAITRCAAQLCLSPSSRAALALKRAKQTEKDSGFEGWLNGGDKK